MYYFDGKKIVMPEVIAPISVWVEFFNKVVAVDCFAPIHILMEHCKFIYDLQITLPPTQHQSLYHDLGIVMSADDERSADEAAIKSGIYAKGVEQLVNGIAPQNPYFGVYLVVLDVIVRDFDCNGIGVDTDVLREAHSFVDGFRKEPLEVLDIERPSRSLPSWYNKRGWITCFRCEMANDPCGSTSMLACYLKQVNRNYHSVFCPLGDDRYYAIGMQMRKSSRVLNAAIQVGLMASAVPAFFDAALDVVDNWRLMQESIRFILESKKLCAFVPFESRVLAEGMLKAFPDGVDGEADEERWYEIIGRLRDELRIGVYHGY